MLYLRQFQRQALSICALALTATLSITNAVAQPSSPDSSGDATINSGGTPIEVDASFLPATVVQGESSQLRWTSVGNVSRCAVSGVPGISGPQPAFGNITVNSNNSLQAVVSCTGSFNGMRDGDSDTATLTVLDSNPPPTVNAGFSPDAIFLGQSSTLSWSSTNATSCSDNSGLNVSGTSGSISVTPSNTITVTITCNGPGGSASDSATVNVSASFPPPFVNASFSPSFIFAGDFTTLFWFSTDAFSCNFGGPSGSLLFGPLFFSTSETVVCTGPGGTGFGTAFVSVAGSFGPQESAAIDQQTREALGLPDQLDAELVSADLNDDSVADELIFVAEQKQLFLRLSDAGGNLELVRIFNGIDSLSEIKQILIQQDTQGQLRIELSIGR